MKRYLLTLFVFINNYTNPFHLNFPKSTDDEEKKDVTSQEIEDEKVQLEDSLVKKGGVHSATWYNPHGSMTASGKRFHRDSLTAAYNFAKFNSLLKVTNISNGLFVYVRVTDRMGIKSSNHIDLSKCAFDSIGNPSSGRIKVSVEQVFRN